VCKKENILLDAVLKDMIDHATFNAVLPNGHAFVAYTLVKDKEKAMAALSPGDRVRVELSPFDMSKGRIMLKASLL
jgi:translation initiation factor IF-1